MNPDVLEIYDVSFSPQGWCTVVAIVEDYVIVIPQTEYDPADCLDEDDVMPATVIVIPQTEYDPAEWGPAMCRGSFCLDEDDVMPATDAGMRRLLSERIDNWEVVDCSDWTDDG
jgi:hypothetical protein